MNHPAGKARQRTEQQQPQQQNSKAQQQTQQRDTIRTAINQQKQRDSLTAKTLFYYCIVCGTFQRNESRRYTDKPNATRTD